MVGNEDSRQLSEPHARLCGLQDITPYDLILEFIGVGIANDELALSIVAWNGINLCCFLRWIIDAIPWTQKYRK